MKKFIVKIAIVAAALSVFSSVFVFDPFHFNLNFLGKELSIEKTANVSTGIKKISEFTTACFFEEKIIQEKKYEYSERVIDHSEEGSSIWNRLKNKVTGKSTEDSAKEVVRDSTEAGQIVFIVKTKVRAGFDLSKISENDLSISNDTLSVKLPEPEIFDIIANPSDWRIYHRAGKWEDNEIRTIQSHSLEGIRQDAIELGLLEKAQTHGKEALVSLFKTFGFKEVVLQ